MIITNKWGWRVGECRLKGFLNCFHIYSDDRTIGLKLYLVKQTSKRAQTRSREQAFTVYIHRFTSIPLKIPHVLFISTLTNVNISIYMCITCIPNKTAPHAMCQHCDNNKKLVISGPENVKINRY